MPSTTQKKKPAASSGGRAPSKKGGQRGASRKTSSRTASAPRPVRREVGAVVCLLLAFFAGIGYFNLEGAVINLMRNLLCGLTGYGFWFAPPALLLGAFILAFHRGRPVRLRLWCSLLCPIILGGLLHLFLCRGLYDLSWFMFPQLWESGLALRSGGALSGALAVLFVQGFSKVGAAAIFLALLSAMLLAAFRVSPADLADSLRQRIEDRAVYEPEPEPIPRRRTRQDESRRPAPEPEPRGSRRRAADIPVEDGPLLGRNQPAQPMTAARKKKLFDSISSVPAPDEVLTDTYRPRLEEEPPEYEDAPELAPVREEPEDVTPPKRRKPASQPEPEPELETEPVPELPEIVREPAVKRKKAEETAAAAEQVGREIETAMSQGAAGDYRYPPLELLREGGGTSDGDIRGELYANQARLSDTIQSFGDPWTVGHPV